MDGGTSKVLRCEQDGPVAVLTLDRPEALNAISPELEDDLHAALDRAEADDSVRVVVLAGAGERAFSAGYDLGEETEPRSTGELLGYWWDVETASAARHWRVMTLEKPVIAAVHGWCLGGAFWYSLACDVTIAADDATFGQPEVRETQNSTALLSFLAGWKNAARYALTGDHFDAQEALRIGVVNEVVPREQLMERTMALAKRMAMVPADSLRLNKRIGAVVLDQLGVRSALDTAGYVSTIVHASSEDSPELQELLEVRRTAGMAASLKLRDDKFRPEPGGPRSLNQLRRS